MTLPHQDRPASLLSPFPWFPLGSLPPLSFWGKHLSKTGLIFALISNLKRLLTPESLAFSPFFPCQAEETESCLSSLLSTNLQYFLCLILKKEAVERHCSLAWVSRLLPSSPASLPLLFLLPLSRPKGATSCLQCMLFRREVCSVLVDQWSPVSE